MNKENLEKDVLKILKKYGFRIDHVQWLQIDLDVKEYPEITIKYKG